MADLLKECIDASLNSINYRRNADRELVLKQEQEVAIRNLLCGKDVVAVLPTGFGKSMIFTVFALARNELLKRSGKTTEGTCVLVISPLKSLIQDQIAELRSLNCTADELCSSTFTSVIASPPQFLYCTAEEAIGQKFIESLKDSNSKIHQSLAAVVVDESHTVETWTGKRKAKGDSAKQPFRSAYGKLSMLRSMCRTGTPVLALTGTADDQTTKTIRKELVMDKDCISLFVSPNRRNLCFSVTKLKKDEMLKNLDWIVKMLQKQREKTPKTIIFCATMYGIASVVNYLMMKLGSQAFHPTESKKREHCLLGIFHSLTHQEYKDRNLTSLKGDGLKRVVVATTALSMGVNFPNIRYVVMWGPPRNLLDFHQEAGRAGRDGQPADVITYFYGQQLAHCEEDMRMFLKSDTCYRVSGYECFDKNILPLLPAHDCCNCCVLSCTCTASGCSRETKPFESDLPPEPVRPTRTVSAENKTMLTEALEELQNKFASNVCHSPFGATSSHGFSKELICDVVDNCHQIFCIKDVQTFVPVFARGHASMILEVINEVFDDLEEAALVTQAQKTESTLEQLFDNDLEYLIASDFEELDVAEELSDLDFVE